MREIDKSNVLKTMRDFNWNRAAASLALMLQASNAKELESVGRNSIASYINKLLIAGYLEMFPPEPAPNENE